MGPLTDVRGTDTVAMSEESLAIHLEGVPLKRSITEGRWTLAEESQKESGVLKRIGEPGSGSPHLHADNAGNMIYVRPRQIIVWKSVDGTERHLRPLENRR